MPPLDNDSMESFVKYIQTNGCKQIIVMTGAGISTAAGIPDFRTKGTGLYDNLQKYNLPYPEAIFDISYFRRKPHAFYTLAKELFPGKFEPTASHRFVRLLASKGMLLRWYTQNIDMLERLSGVPEDLLVEAHGSFHLARCVGRRIDDQTDDVEENSDCDESDGCGATYSIDEFKAKLDAEDPMPLCVECGGLIKPDIVFFGEQLPDRFHRLVGKDFSKCDALIVMGTSLQVQPFAGLIRLVGPSVPRLLINREVCGSNESIFSSCSDSSIRDAKFLGDCDAGSMEFMRLLGWSDSLTSDECLRPSDDKPGELDDEQTELDHQIASLLSKVTFTD